jgi:hypothetical protein
LFEAKFADGEKHRKLEIVKLEIEKLEGISDFSIFNFKFDNVAGFDFKCVRGYNDGALQAWVMRGYPKRRVVVVNEKAVEPHRSSAGKDDAQMGEFFFYGIGRREGFEGVGLNAVI